MPKTERDLEISKTVQSLRRIFKAMQYIANTPSDFGVTGLQLWALRTISQHGSLSLGDLGKKMCLVPSGVTGVVDRLEAKGYVSRDRGPGDRRVVKVHLTAAGKELVQKGPSPIHEKMIHALRSLESKELHAIYRSATKLAEILEA